MENFESLFLILTKNCNLKCKYCYEGHTSEMMSVDTAYKAIDLLKDKLLKSGNKEMDITFFGGEPLLNLEVIDKAFDYALEIAIDNGFKLMPSIVTNCTIFTDDYYNFLRKWKCALGKISVQLSIDGIPEVQDVARPSKNEIPSSTMVLSALDRYLDFAKEFQCELGNEIHVHSVITKNSLKYMYANYNYILSFGFPGLWTLAVQEEDWDDDDASLYRDQLTKIKDSIIERCKDGDSSAYQANAGLAKKFSCHPNRTCGAGVSTFCVVPNGDIYPCSRLIYDEFLIGNINNADDVNSDMLKIFDNVAMEACKKCSDCDNFECYRCMGANYEQNGDLSIGFPKYCQMALVEQEIRKELNNALNTNDREDDTLEQLKRLTESINSLITPIGNSMDKLLELTESNSEQLNNLTQTVVALSVVVSEIVNVIGGNKDA